MELPDRVKEREDPKGKKGQRILGLLFFVEITALLTLDMLRNPSISFLLFCLE